MANTTAATPSASLPLSLGGISLAVRGPDGVSRRSPLLFVSPGQINFVVPADTPPGAVAFNVMRQSNQAEESRANPVFTGAPAIFTADSSGTGVAAAIAVTGNAANTAVEFFLTGVPTGITSSTTFISASLNGKPVTVTYLGPQGQYLGLYQLNVEIPNSYRGPGNAQFEFQFRPDSFTLLRSNSVLLNFQ